MASRMNVNVNININRYKMHMEVYNFHDSFLETVTSLYKRAKLFSDGTAEHCPA